MDLLDKLTSLGFKYKVVSITHLLDLKKEITEKYNSGILKEEVFNRYLAGLSFNGVEEVQGAKSIITIAVPRFRTQAVFTMDGNKHAYTVPPTYWKYKATVEEIREILLSILNGYRVEKTSLSEKLLAVRSGLAYYGKNNVTYIPGWGSFYQLVSYITDMPAVNDEWHDYRMLERCNSCNACEKVCPTNAITAERFTINAERCITFYNENDEDFPEWINPKNHNSLVGCMYCQYYCPENKQFRNNIDNETEFDENETNLILDADVMDELPVELTDKLHGLDIVNNHVDFKNFQRNLRALLRNSEVFL